MHRDHICWMPMANINFLNTKLFSFSSPNSGNDATAYHLWVWTCNRLRQKLMQIDLKVSHKTTKKRHRKKNWVSSSYSIPCNDSHKQPEWFTLTWQHNVQVKAVVTDLLIPLEYEESVTCPCPSLQLSLVCCLFQTVSPEQWCMRHEKALSLGKWKRCSADGKVLEGKGPVGACSICFCCGRMLHTEMKGTTRCNRQDLHFQAQNELCQATFARDSSLMAASLQGNQ